MLLHAASKTVHAPQATCTRRLTFPMLQYPGGKPRSVEDLKARYYSVARQLLVEREGGETGIANHVLIKHPYNAEQER